MWLVQRFRDSEIEQKAPSNQDRTSGLRMNNVTHYSPALYQTELSKDGLDETVAKIFSPLRAYSAEQVLGYIKHSCTVLDFQTTEVFAARHDINVNDGIM